MDIEIGGNKIVYDSTNPSAGTSNNPLQDFFKALVGSEFKLTISPEMKVVKIEADDYYFGPTFLRGKPGQRVRLRIENESGTLHNITIAGQQVDRDILPKKTIEVEVTIPESGALVFSCKFHGPLGMNGQLAAR